MSNFEYGTFSVEDVIHTLRECDRNEHYSRAMEYMLDFASELTGMSVDALVEAMYKTV